MKTMNDRDLAEFNSAVRMSEFGAANSAELKSLTKVVAGFADLNADIAALETTGATRVSADGTRSDGTVDKRTAKDSLYETVRRIARTARTIKKVEPDFNDKYKLTEGTLSGQNLVELATAFRDDFVTDAAKFAEYGLPATVSQTLTDKIAAYESARAEQNTGAGSGVAMTAQIRAVMKNLMQTRRMLRTIVANFYLDNPAKSAEWKSACHVKKPDAPKNPVPPTP